MKKANRNQLKLDASTIRLLTPELALVPAGVYGNTAYITCTCYTLATTTNAGCK